MTNQPKYGGLTSLLEQDPACRRYFDSLPEYIQETVQERGNAICSSRDLRRYVNNLTECL